MTMDFIFEQPAPGGAIGIEFKILGSYEHKGDEFSLTAEDMDMKISNMPPALKSQEAKMLEAFEGNGKKEMIDQVNSLKEAKLTWVSDTSFRLTWDKGTMTLTKA